MCRCLSYLGRSYYIIYLLTSNTRSWGIEIKSRSKVGRWLSLLYMKRKADSTAHSTKQTATHLPTYLPTYLHTQLSTPSPTYLYPLTYLPTYLPTYRDYGTDRESALYCPIGGLGSGGSGGGGPKAKEDKTLADYYHK